MKTIKEKEELLAKKSIEAMAIGSNGFQINPKNVLKNYISACKLLQETCQLRDEYALQHPNHYLSSESQILFTSVQRSVHLESQIIRNSFHLADPIVSLILLSFQEDMKEQSNELLMDLYMENRLNYSTMRARIEKKVNAAMYPENEWPILGFNGDGDLNDIKWVTKYEIRNEILTRFDELIKTTPNKSLPTINFSLLEKEERLISVFEDFYSIPFLECDNGTELSKTLVTSLIKGRRVGDFSRMDSFMSFDLFKHSFYAFLFYLTQPSVYHKQRETPVIVEGEYSELCNSLDKIFSPSRGSFYNYLRRPESGRDYFSLVKKELKLNSNPTSNQLKLNSKIHAHPEVKNFIKSLISTE